MSEKGHTVQVQLRTHKPRSSVRLIDNNELEFAFPAIGKDCILRMNFQRTLRVPDDEVNNLPPGLDRFELEHVEDYEGRIPQKWLEHGGLMLPMYQAEAMWISFRSPREYPFAVRIAAGKICASSLIPYPPGVPIACPGEVLTEEVLAYVKARRAADEKVIGITADGYVFVGK